MHWFREDFRKVLLIHVSPAWAKRRGSRLNTRELVASLDAAQARCIQPFAKDHHGYCYFRSSLGRPYPTDVMGEIIREARPRGMRVIAYYSVGFDAYATGMHPEWLHVGSDGRPSAAPTGPFPWACLNSPYREYCLRQIEELAAGYDLDGIWLDILPLRPASIEIDARPGLSYVPDAPCYCPSCQALYRDRFGRDIPLVPAEGDRVRGFQLRVDGARSFVREVARIARSHRPDAIVTYNGSGKPVDAMGCADLSSVEAHAPDYLLTSFYGRWGRHSGRMSELYSPQGLPGSGLGFNAWDLKPVEMLELESAIVMAHGGVLWLCQSPYPDGSTDPAQYDTIKHVFTFVKGIEPYLADAQSAGEIALAMTNQPYTAPAHGHESMLATQAFHQALLHGHYQFDILKLPQDLSRYRLLVLGEQSVMGDSDADAVRRYVSEGGLLFATGTTSLFDAAGGARRNFALADVLGVDFRAHSQQPFVYLRLEDDAIGQLIPRVPLLAQVPSAEVEVTTGRVLGSMVYPELRRTDALTILWGYPPPDDEQRHPGLVLNQYGKGLCVYSAVGFPCRLNDWARITTKGRETANSPAGNALEVIWTERLARNVVRRLLPDPVLDTDAPGGVEVVLNRWHDGYLVHLINHYAGDAFNPSYAGDRLVQRDIVVRLNTKRLGRMTRASRLPQGTAIEARSVGEDLEFVVPDFDIHCLLQVE